MGKQQIIKIPQHTPEWYDFRQQGIGGSEVGTVLGINKYDTAVRLFHEKVGTIPQRTDTNERMYWGRLQEDLIAETWQYYDGTEEGYVENAEQGRIVRKCKKIDGYVVNEDYPWLFASVDRLINKTGGYNLITGEPLMSPAILECKAMSYWTNRMWDDGIPISYLAQIHQYMAILETDYAEIAMLIDSGRFVVERIMRDDELTERLLQITHDWWHKRILPAREALEQRNAAEIKASITEYEKAEARLQELEPPPDSSEAYEEFMSDSFDKARDAVEGTHELLTQAKRDKLLQKLRSRIDKERSSIRNVFVNYLVSQRAEAVDFGRMGYVSWTQSKGKERRTFSNRIKETPEEAVIEQEFEKINQHAY